MDFWQVVDRRQYLTHLQRLVSNKHTTTTTKHHTTISHLLNRKRLDEVEEVSNADTHKTPTNTKYLPLLCLIDALLHILKCKFKCSTTI
jgi:hypothetical protein